MKSKWNMRAYGRFFDLGFQLAVGFGLGFAGGW